MIDVSDVLLALLALLAILGAVGMLFAPAIAIAWALRHAPEREPLEGPAFPVVLRKRSADAVAESAPKAKDESPF